MHNQRQHHKMHIGEIVFHLLVPFTVFAIVMIAGYYVVTLVLDVLKVH